MTTTVLLAMGFGLGVSLLVRLLVPSQPGLAVAVARLDAAARSRGGSVRVAPPAQGGRWERRLQTAEFLVGERLAGQLAERGVLGADLRTDLRLLQIDERSYTARKLLLAAGTLVLAPVVLAAVCTVLGLSWLTAAWVSVLLALAVFVLPDSRVRQVARRRRRDFTAATAAYLDLVAMRVASGSGVTEALRQAAGVGSGEAFARIQLALDDAKLLGSTSGQSLVQLGEQLGVVELEQLGAQLTTVSSAGARAEATLRAKADALRARQLTQAQSAAKASSETMVLGVGGLALGFTIIIAYPALNAVLGL